MEEFNSKLDATVNQLTSDATLPINLYTNPNLSTHNTTTNFTGHNNTFDNLKFQLGQKFSPIVSINSESSGMNLNSILGLNQTNTYQRNTDLGSGRDMLAGDGPRGNNFANLHSPQQKNRTLGTEGLHREHNGIQSQGKKNVCNSSRDYANRKNEDHGLYTRGTGGDNRDDIV